MSVNATEARTQLLAKLDDLVRRGGAIATHLRQQDGRNEADFEDRAQITANDEVLEQLDDSGRAEVGAIRAALDRLDAGTYGVCVSCGGAIAPGRLAVLPEVARCAACAS